MFRIITVALIMILNIVLQSTFVQEFAIGGITMNLLMITVVSFALIRGKIEGAIIGFLLGMMQDIFFGNVIGFYALLYMYIGFFAGFINRALYKDNIMIPLLVISSADFLFNLIIYIITYLFRGRTDFIYYLINIMLPELVYTTFVSIFVYKLYVFINERLDIIEKNKEDKDKV